VIRLFALLILWAAQAGTAPAAEFEADLAAFPDRVRADIKALARAYPEFVAKVDGGPNGGPVLVMKDGARIPYDDGRPKAYEEKLDTADIEDMLSQPYTVGPLAGGVEVNEDPGRIRNDPFFQAIYGRSAADVRKGLVSVDFCGTRIQFHGTGKAAQALGRVSADLSSLLKAKPDLKEYVFPLGGTFNWRTIEGTRRLSPHSYGVALDLNAAKGAYWRWTGDRKGAVDDKVRRKYPMEIVAAFEKHGFIWGGKWYHFDLMHFEYRPELVFPAGPAS
jgi:hypothetical protein